MAVSKRGRAVHVSSTVYRHRLFDLPAKGISIERHFGIGNNARHMSANASSLVLLAE